MATDNIITTAIDFLNTVRENPYVKIKFQKKDGTNRIMKCTLNFDKIPANKKPLSVNLPKILRLLQQSKIIHVYDLEKNDWRSVPFNEVEWLETSNDTRYKISIK